MSDLPADIYELQSLVQIASVTRRGVGFRSRNLYRLRLTANADFSVNASSNSGLASREKGHNQRGKAEILRATLRGVASHSNSAISKQSAGNPEKT